MTDPTLTVGIDRDEWWPVYSIVSLDVSYAETCTVPAALVVRAEAAAKEFDAVQRELMAAWNASADRAAQS